MNLFCCRPVNSKMFDYDPEVENGLFVNKVSVYVDTANASCTCCRKLARKVNNVSAVFQPGLNVLMGAAGK